MQIAFFVLAAIAVVAAIGIVRADNIIHAILSHIVTLICIAALYILLGAEFVAGVQVMIYAGAVTIMLLFSMMLTKVATGGTKTLDYPQVTPALLVAGLFLFLNVYSIRTTKWHTAMSKAVFTPAEVGRVLFKYYVLPFEIVSVILLAALVGAVTLARKEES